MITLPNLFMIFQHGHSFGFRSLTNLKKLFEKIINSQMYIHSFFSNRGVLIWGWGYDIFFSF